MYTRWLACPETHVYPIQKKRQKMKHFETEKQKSEVGVMLSDHMAGVLQPSCGEGKNLTDLIIT